MPLQPRDMLDQPRHLAQRQCDGRMSLSNDPPRPTRGQAQFLRGCDTFILAGGQRIHIRVQIGQPRRILLYPQVQLAQKARGFAALQRDVA